MNELNTRPSTKKSSSSGAQVHAVPCGGIDSLDLSEIMDENNESKNGQNGEKEESSAESSDPFKGEDPTSKISCEMIQSFH